MNKLLTRLEMERENEIILIDEQIRIIFVLLL